MQKKLIALAVAGLVSGAAFAQANVTVYGVADGYYANIKADGVKSVNALNSGGLSGSRLGFKGAESLGNGLTAVFQYEFGTLALDTQSNGIGSTRQSYVGLAGGFGTVVLGRLQTPGYYVGNFDALASAAISPQAILATGKMNGGLLGSTIAPNNMGRANSAIAYISPDFSGFSAVIAASTGPVSDEQVIPDGSTTADEGAWVLGLNYKAGPLAVGFVHHDIKNVYGVDAYDTKENMIGGSYNFGVATVLGSYQDAKVKDTDKNKLWQLGVVVPVGAGNVHVAYGKLDMAAADSNAKSWTLAYTYGLSKRTTAYAGYNHTDNDAHSAVGMGGIATAGGATKGFAVGLRHTF